MQPVNYPINNQVLQQIWQSFVETGQIVASLKHKLDPIVYRSWQRCAPLLDPRSLPRPAILEPKALQRERTLPSQAHLLTIAHPFMEDIHQFAENSGVALLLTDGTGCIIDVLGDQQVVKTLREQDLQWAYTGTKDGWGPTLWPWPC